MGWQRGRDSGAGAEPGRDPELPGGGAPPARDPRLGWFAGDGLQGGPVPSGLLALAADELSGLERRCPRATDNELVGLLRAWAAIESWAAGAKLGVIRELMRRDGAPSPGAGHGDLPEAWSPSLRHELAGALACSVQSAETTIWLAWEQQARLPGTGALLDDGILTYAKARAITETFQYLTDADAARAEALILNRVAGKTYPQVLRLAEQAALTVDPGLAERRREQAQQKDARVTFLREQSGTAALCGRDLPPDEALAAMASVNARAELYRESGAFGDTPMDALRAQAYLDLLNDKPAADRIAEAEAYDAAADAAETLAWLEARAAARNTDTATATDCASSSRTGGHAQADQGDCPCAGRDGGCTSADGRHDPADTRADADGQDNRDEDSRDPGDGNDGDGDGSGDEPGPGSGGTGPDGSSPRPGVSPAGLAPRRQPADLIVPLTTLLGLAERPGEIQGFGLLDPALARKMAKAAAASTRTEVCVTVTSPEGYAIGHGCARPDRASHGNREPGTALPARLNLTIPATALPGLTGRDRRAGPWAFTQRGTPSASGGTGSPDGYGTWTLTLPGGQRFAVRLDPVPTFDCDHRYESHGYQPSDRLRHLVQVRDGTCTFPPCSRHARESDFEHALPYDKGGRTCTCNAGARSRACHRVKQSPGWAVTQPKPGWHQWTTPAGRIYVQEPKRYSA